MFTQIFNASIGKRIFVAALVPIVGIALFGAYIISAEFSRYSSLAKLQTLASVAPQISAIAHELQNERGLSSTFIHTNGDDIWQDRLDVQIAKTDVVLSRVLADLQAFPASDYGVEFEEQLSTSLAEFEKLAGFRERTLSTRTTISATSLYYTETIRGLLDSVATISAIASDAEIKGRSTAYVSLLEIKERAGMERAMGTKGYGNNHFNSDTHSNFVTLIGQQDSFMEVFASYASDEERAFYDATVTGSIVDEVEYQRDVAVEAGYDEIYDTITATEWFDNISAKINLIKQVEDFVSTNLIAAADGALSSARTKLLTTLALTLASLAIASTACFFVGRSITKPLSDLQRTMVDVAKGSFDINITGARRNDEVGDMARAVEAFRDQGREAEQLKKDQFLAEQSAAEEKRRSLNQMADDLESSIGQMIDGLSNSSNQLEKTARDMRELATTTNTEAGAVGEASAGATRNVEAVAAAATQLSTAIGEVTSQISLSAQLTTASQAASEKTDGQMKNLGEAAKRISSVMELIQEIAEQTNLLALNATIEAARAGEAGKGFAVVASEVKDLANQTAKATGEISQNVSRVQEGTQSAALAMAEISEKIGEINNVTTAVSGAVEQQSAATLEISRTAEETAEMNRNVSASIDTVKSAAEQTGSAASQVLNSAEELSHTAESLRAKVSTFVQSIRAA